ncbi:MAG: DNA polymerase III subunit delta [Candidatus Paceibacterota bacterium]
MIILIFGKDSYQSSRRLADFISLHKQKHSSGLNLRRFEGKAIDFENLKKEMFEASMFKEKKLIIIDNAFENTKFKEAFLGQGEKFFTDENVLVFYEAKEILAKDKFLNYLKEIKAKFENFDFLSPAKTKTWIKQEVSNNKVEISDSALEELIDYLGNDLWSLSNEIKKLAHYVLANKKKEITSAEIKKLIIPDLELNIFEAIDAIANKNKKKAINLLKEHLKQGAEVPYLFSMVAWQIKNIIIAKTSSQGFGESGISPFIFRKSANQAKNFSLDDLKRIYQKIIDLDAALKVGKIFPETALDLLILEI